MTIRPATPADAPALREAVYQAIHVPPGEPPPDPSVLDGPALASLNAGWGRPGDRALLAEADDGTRLGAAWVRLWPGPERGYGFVDEDTPELGISVVPGHRGRGIGTALLRALLAEVARHHEAVSLSVSKTNPARRLYEREGFTVVAEAGDALTMLRRF